MATVDKNFRIKNGLVVEGSTATVNGNDILAKNTQDGDSYIINLIGGTATPENTANTVVKRDANGNFAAGIITANIVGNVTGTVSDISNHSTSSLSEGTNLYFTNQRAIDANTGLWDTVGAAEAALSDAQDYADTAESDAVAASQSYTNAEITYALQTAQGYANTAESDAISAAAADATSKANAAQLAAEQYATSAASDAESNAILAAASDATSKANAAQAAAEQYADGLAVNYDAAGAASAAQTAAASDATSKANAAQAAAEATAAAALSSAISTEVSNRNTAISNAVDSLVDGAPALLNTLNELAAAINDDANYTTTITTALGTKANSADVTTDIATAVSTAASDATSKANAAQAAAEATASADATSKANAAEAAAEATAQAALDDVLDGTTPFTDLNINDVAKQVAARTTSLGSVVVTAYQFNKSAFKSGKFLVKIDNGTHNEISEILVTLDSADNVAITEYGIVGTNGSRGTITADVDGTHCRIRVNPVNDSTITVSGTVFNA
jgi:hypothetical protein